MCIYDFYFLTKTTKTISEHYEQDDAIFEKEKRKLTIFL